MRHFCLQLDGNSHVVYAEEEAAGTRLLINGQTCLLQVLIWS
jgi:acetyl-CoA carboxylase/biotin carboxylase 1